MRGTALIAAGVVLRDPDGGSRPMELMHALRRGIDRYGTEVTPDGPGDWSFRVEAWADPIADWHHDADIKVPRGQDIELMMAEGAQLFERASKSIKVLPNRVPNPGPGRARGGRQRPRRRWRGPRWPRWRPRCGIPG